MNIGVITSTIAHVAILAFGVLTISSPKALEVSDVEALPIDIVPISEFTRNIQGEKKAELNEKPAPKPTLKPALDIPAAIVGDAKTDTRGERSAKTAPVPKQAADEASGKPVPAAKPAETSELAAEPQPKVNIATLLRENTDIAAEPEQLPDQEIAKLPERIPVPKQRPSQPKAQAAKTNIRKKAKEPPVKVAALTPDSKKKKNNNTPKLLDKSEPKGGGAKRSKKKASLGTRKTNSKVKLSLSEMDALRGQIQRCFDVTLGMADAENLRVKVEFRLDETGTIDGAPTAKASGGSKATRRAFAGRARRAVQRCAPYKLPREKYEDWAEVEVNFSLQDML